MKTSVLSKSILVLAVMFLCNLAMSAASPREYMYDTKEENGKVISKVIFLNDNGLLNKEVMHRWLLWKLSGRLLPMRICWPV